MNGMGSDDGVAFLYIKCIPFFFNPGVARDWNGLPQETVQAPHPWHLLLKGLYILISFFFSFQLAFPHHAFFLQQFLKI